MYSSSHAALPEQDRSRARDDLATAGSAASQRAEFSMAPTAMAEAARLASVHDTPLYVLTAPVDDAHNGWYTTQTELAAMSTNTIHTVVAGPTMWLWWTTRSSPPCPARRSCASWSTPGPVHP